MTRAFCGRLTAGGALFLFLFAASDSAYASSPGSLNPAARARFIKSARALMSELRAESRVDADRIKDSYRRELADSMLRDRSDLVEALDEGDVTYLPADPQEFNIQPRLAGPSPIGEKDLAHQPLYVAARPETLGCLMQVAARVRSAPVEVTSLVRHQRYQRALQRTNANARTSVPTHTLGLAFDISIINMPLDAAREIRDVLLQMRADGDVLFIAETRQLVFHVVPAPERLDYFRAVYDAMMIAPPVYASIELPQLPLHPAVANLESLTAAGAVPARSRSPWPFGAMIVAMLYAVRRFLPRVGSSPHRT